MKPAIVRPAEITTGTVFLYGARPLRVDSVKGRDPAAPVICEELTAWGNSLKGQLALWSVDGVLRAMSGLGT